MEKDLVVWTFSFHWIYGLILGIEHMTADDNVSWMIVIHLFFIRIMIEKAYVKDGLAE